MNMTIYYKGFPYSLLITTTNRIRCFNLSAKKVIVARVVLVFIDSLFESVFSRMEEGIN